jgi:hypothetical protein
MLEVGGTLYQWIQYLAPITLVIIAIIFTAAVTKGYRGFISGVAEILKSKYSLLFFIIVVGLLIYLWSELKTTIGW